MSVYKNEGQEGKTNPFWGWYQWEGGGHKETPSAAKNKQTPQGHGNPEEEEFSFHDFTEKVTACQGLEELV
jgi:hypothetical protein